MENKSLFKKIFVAVFILILLGGVFAIIFFVGFNNKTVKITDLEVTKSSIILNVGDKIDLKDYYTTKPLNVSANVLCLAGNSHLASINNENILTANNVGETTIYLKVGSGDNLLEENIVLKIEQLKTLPQSLSFAHSSMTLMLGDTSCQNKLTTTGSFSSVGKVEYSVAGICEYNLTTGIITPKSIGKTKVTVTFSNNKTQISKSFDVGVKSQIEKEIVLSANGILLESGEFSLSASCGQIRKINIIYKENNVETSFNFKITIISNSCNAVAEKERNALRISASSTGTAVIKIEIVGKDKFVILNFKSN